MQILIAGGGKVGLHLIRTLRQRGHVIGLVERDPRVCKQIVAEFNEIVVRVGDATNPTLLAEANRIKADVVIAACGRDQDNYAICKMARKLFDIPMCVARVNDPRNETLFKLAGVDHTISVTTMVTNAIETQIIPAELTTLFTWHERMAMVEIELSPESPVVGTRIRKLDFPPGSILAAIWRNNGPLIPDGETELRAGDEIFAVTMKAQQDELRRMLLGH
ncbi:MAG: TrkA family potassium uptake protein [Candidatus Sericytochromatia bacterium]|nr:TrkA family potassium uptake protein [Candidatus Sericytochromatia bacterium]